MLWLSPFSSVLICIVFGIALVAAEFVEDVNVESLIHWTGKQQWRGSSKVRKLCVETNKGPRVEPNKLIQEGVEGHKMQESSTRGNRAKSCCPTGWWLKYWLLIEADASEVSVGGGAEECVPGERVMLDRAGETRQACDAATAVSSRGLITCIQNRTDFKSGALYSCRAFLPSSAPIPRGFIRKKTGTQIRDKHAERATCTRAHAHLCTRACAWNNKKGAASGALNSHSFDYRAPWR